MVLMRILGACATALAIVGCAPHAEQPQPLTTAAIDSKSDERGQWLEAYRPAVLKEACPSGQCGRRVSFTFWDDPADQELCVRFGIAPVCTPHHSKPARTIIGQATELSQDGTEVLIRWDPGQKETFFMDEPGRLDFQ